MNPHSLNKGQRPEINDILMKLVKMRAKEMEANNAEQMQSNSCQASRANIPLCEYLEDKDPITFALFLESLTVKEIQCLLD